MSLDEEGAELPDIAAAHDLAVDALADAARDAVLEGTMDQTFLVQVRNEIGPVLEVTAVFGSKLLLKN